MPREAPSTGAQERQSRDRGREIAEPEVQAPLPRGPTQMGRGRRAGGHGGPQTPRKPLRRTDEDRRRQVLKRSDLFLCSRFVSTCSFPTIPAPLSVEPWRLRRDVSENNYAGKNFTVRVAGRQAAPAEQGGAGSETGRPPCGLRPTFPLQDAAAAGLPRSPRSTQTARSRNKGPAPPHRPAYMRDRITFVQK